MTDRVPSLRLVSVCAVAAFLAGLVTERQCGPHTPTPTVTEPQQLAGGVVRSGEQQGSAGSVASAASSAGAPVEVILRDSRGQGAALTGANTATVKTAGRQESGLPSTSSERRAPEPHAPPKVTETSCAAPASCLYAGTTEKLELHDVFGTTKVPWGEVSFRAADAKPWGLTVLPRTLRLTTVVATREDGTHALYSHALLDVSGTNYVLPIDDARWVEQEPEPAWRWSARAYLGAGAGWTLGAGTRALWGASAQVSLASYGRTTSQPSWAFGLLGLGLTSERRPALALSPAVWNAGDVLPLVDTVFVGPSLLVDSTGQASAFVSVLAKL